MIVLYTIHDWAAHGVNKLCDVLLRKHTQLLTTNTGQDNPAHMC